MVSLSSCTPPCIKKLAPLLCLLVLSGGELVHPAGVVAAKVDRLDSLDSQAPNSKQASLCPQPALSRLTRHRIAAGETVESIAAQYDLIPATLIGLNPVLQGGNAPTGGTEILIPPYNGVRVEVPAGSSWREVAKQYNVRADVLFEVNGCQESPGVVFVPGVNWSPNPAPTGGNSARNPLTGYPLPTIAPILTPYGWQLNTAIGEVVFQSGVNLAATAGTPVLAAGAGTVAFAGTQGNQGQVVVINHAQGLQTRYAQLANVSVQVGQTVQAGDRIGTVAAINSTSQGNSPTNPQARSQANSFLRFEVRSNSALGWVAQDPGSYIPDFREDSRLRRRGEGQSE